MDWALASNEGILFLLRWAHFIFGVIWIGILYYFNFVQMPFFGETDAATKSNAIQKLVPRALWWFRWAAMWTWVSGLVYLSMKGSSLGAGMFTSSWGISILTGAALGTIMWANVWFVIWPNQKILIQSTTQVAQGQAALPNAAAAGNRAAVASRTNTLFSMPLLFFMGAASHLPFQVSETSNTVAYWGAFAVIALLIEVNALKAPALKGPLKTPKGVIGAGLALALLIYVLAEVIL